MLKGGTRTTGKKRVSTMEEPLISVVTVVYNGGKTLEQTIQSVLDQTYDNVEYIIIDGNSKDNTLDIIKKYEDKIDYWQSEPDTGIYDAMNKGIKLATGDYIALLNADDWYEPRTCEIVKENIVKNEADIFYGLLRYYNANNEVIKIQGDTSKNLRYACIAHPTCFVKRTVYSIRLYDTNYCSAADYDLLIWATKENLKFHFIEEIMTNFRLDGMSSTKKSFLESISIQYKYGYISKTSFLLHYLYYKYFK